MFRENNNGFWEDKREMWKRKKRERKKDIYCGPWIIKEGMTLSYPVKFKLGKSCLRRPRPYKSRKKKSRV